MNTISTLLNAIKLCSSFFFCLVKIAEGLNEEIFTTSEPANSSSGNAVESETASSCLKLASVSSKLDRNST